MALPHYDPSAAEPQRDFYLQVAADLVARLAPPPVPETLDYRDRATRAERLLLEYLTATKGGALSGRSLSGMSSRSFRDDAQVRGVVQEVMGPYYLGGSVAYVGTFPA